MCDFVTFCCNTRGDSEAKTLLTLQDGQRAMKKILLYERKNFY